MSLSDQDRERLDEALWGGCIYDDVPLVVAQIVADHVAAALEQAARAVWDAKPPHVLRNYTPVDAAYDNAAQVVRAQIHN